METLLSLSFDNISSRNANKISKGLRQIEGLLAQICLSASPLQSASNRSSSGLSFAGFITQYGALDQLAKDAAFLELFRLQESFEWNVATRLTETLERLLGLQSDAQSERLITSTLTLLHGLLLLHPPSRALFSREAHLTLLLDLLDPNRNNAQILCAALLVLLTCMIDRPYNTRLLEANHGIEAVCIISQSSAGNITREVRTMAVEVLSYYLLPEIPWPGTASPSPPSRSASSFLSGGIVPTQFSSKATPVYSCVPSLEVAPEACQTLLWHSHRYSKITTSANFRTDRGSRTDCSCDGSEACITRSREEKKSFLGNFLVDVEDQVQDFMAEKLTTADHESLLFAREMSC